MVYYTSLIWLGNVLNTQSEIVNVGDEVTVKVLKFDKDRTRVSLGFKTIRSRSLGLLSLKTTQ